MVYGLIPDALINIFLLGAFGVYATMGLVFFITGVVYMGDAGAIGSTGLYLLVVGAIMLVIGGIALWAARGKHWLVLFFIELFNVALFVFLYVLVVVVIMMAMGVTDPVRRVTTEGWDDIIPSLTLPGSNPDGDGAAASGTYCQMQSAGTACTIYYEGTDGAPFDLVSPCSFGTGYTAMEVLNNCSLLGDLPAHAPASDVSHCTGWSLRCGLCRAACMEAQIEDVKDMLLPASVFVLGLMCYLVIVIVWNNIMIADDWSPGEDHVPCRHALGYALNGGLLGLSLFMLVFAGVGAAKAADACPGGTDCTPQSIYFIVAIALALLVLSGVMLWAIHVTNNMIMGLVTVVMVFMAVALVLAAIILGMSTGVVMDDMEYYYTTQYPKLRSALEKADNSFCRMSQTECTTMVTDATGINDEATKVTVGKFEGDGDTLSFVVQYCAAYSRNMM